MSEDNTQDSNQSHDSTNPENAHLAQIEELKLQVDKFKNEYLYMRAEFDNYKRNAIKERSDVLKYGSERVISEILGVVDNFERALEAKVTPDNLNVFVKGVEMTSVELKNVLQKYGVSEVETQNKPFDPMMHEALSSEETSEIPEGHVFRVFKKAYKLHDKVIRPAQVVVAKKPSN